MNFIQRRPQTPKETLCNKETLSQNSLQSLQKRRKHQGKKKCSLDIYQQTETSSIFLTSEVSCYRTGQEAGPDHPMKGTKSMCIAVQLRKFFFHNSQLHNERLLDESQNP